MSIFAERLVALRKQRGLSQEGLGDAVDMEQSEVSRYERSKREPSKEALMAFADFFGVSLDYLIGRTGEGVELPPFARDLQAAGNEVYAEGPEIRIPVYEEAAAGNPCIADERSVGMQQVPADAVKDDVMGYMLVKVKGESMIYSGIVPGSLALIHRQPVVDDMQIALIRVFDEATHEWRVAIKQLHFINGNQVQLLSSNPSVPMSEKRLDEVVVIGLVKEAYVRFP